MNSKSRLLSAISFLILALFLILPSLSPAAMSDYCQVPPFVVSRVQPNLLLMIDNSASQYDLAYIAGSTTTPPTINCGQGITTTGTFCYDNTYSDNYTYVGYFDPAKNYQYSNPGVNNSIPASNDNFVVVSSIPSSCTYGGTASTPYVCINMPVSTVTGFYATGNFLNWLSASKFDVQKQALTGGKYDTTNSLLIGESRGCNGRRFVKADPNLSGITFAARGPGASDPDFANPDTQGGYSRIEIYKGTNPNMQACQCAVAEWTSGSSHYGQASTDSKSCLNLSQQNHELSAFNQILQDCWTIKGNIANGDPPFGSTGNNPSFNSTEQQCQNVYNDICGSKSGQTCSGTGIDPTTNPGSITGYNPTLTNETSGAWQCTSIATHLSPPAPYDSFGTDTLGFVGRCATFSWQGNNLKVNWADSGPNNCVQREILHYCYGVTYAEVVDPSEGAASTAATGNIPAALMDASVRSLGTPAGTSFIRVGTTPAPTGLIQEFQNLIRFGAMQFNFNGSASECNAVGSSTNNGSNITCPQGRCSVTTNKVCSSSADCPSGQTCIPPSTNMDGAQVISLSSYIQSYCSVHNSTICNQNSDCPSGETCTYLKVGDHSSGLIKTIDGVVAQTWTPYSEAFYNAIGYFAQRTDMRLNTADFIVDSSHNPVQYSCQQNNVLFITDGMSTADVLSSSVTGLVTTYNDGDTYIDTAISSTCPAFAGSRNVDDLAWLAHNKNITDFTSTATPPASQSITSHVVYTGTSTSDPNECNPQTLMQDTATNGNGLFQKVEKPADLQNALRAAFQLIVSRATSGTAASVLASGEGSGANLVQAIFYPSTKRISLGGTFDKEIQWIGKLPNYWYYVDPWLRSSSILEDTTVNNILDISNDRKVVFSYDATNGYTVGNCYNFTTGSSANCGQGTTPVRIEYLKNLWDAGVQLWQRNLSTNPRIIYANCNITGATCIGTTGLMDFSTATSSNVTALKLYMQTADTTQTSQIIKYIHGYDRFCSGTATPCNQDSDCSTSPKICTSNYRSRTVSFDLNGNGTIDSGEGPYVWKLGDIINSTPRISSWVPLNTYQKIYSDSTYGTVGQDPSLEDPADPTHFITTSSYKSRGMVFTGANDGMLHAFNLGTMNLKWTVPTQTSTQYAEMTGSNLGKEIWAFIPKNALPYLKYMADPAYCHVYTVDISPYIFDASIGGSSDTADTTKTVSSWRSILIGGMRFGGACKPKVCSTTTTTKCSADSDCPAGESCVAPSSNSVGTPILDPSDSTKGLGYSTYFALDITDQNYPILLWEFSSEDLGFASTGPAVVRINATGDTNGLNKNGHWFVVFGSGPSGPIDTTSQQFMGRSDQNLKLFVFDIKTGPGTNNTNVTTISPSTAITNAFAGSMLNTTHDNDLNYQDDVLYIPYVQKDDTAGTWTKGGVLRLTTKEDPSPGNWVLSTVIKDIGPVTSSVVRLQKASAGKLWLYFGSGRFFYETPSTVDDLSGQRTLYGIIEPCYKSTGFDKTCADAAVSPTDATTSPPSSAPANGWYITLDAAVSGSNGAERVITDPVSSTGGYVFFTTFQPYDDVCKIGGKTYLWALKYDTGGVPAGIKGTAMVQVSTGAIEQKDLSTALTDKGGRRTAAIEGVPPTAQGLSIVSTPPPVKRTIHIRER